MSPTLKIGHCGYWSSAEAQHGPPEGWLGENTL